MRKSNYGKLLLMQGASFVVMYIVMFLNVDDTDHIYMSLTRTYMTLMMIAPMALLMLLLMGNMYPNKKLNAVVIVTAIVVFTGALAGLRTQTPVTDVQYMQAMIPHHSSALLTSKHADIKDPEVKALSEQIIKAQKEEIAQMEAMIKRLE